MIKVTAKISFIFKSLAEKGKHKKYTKRVKKLSNTVVQTFEKSIYCENTDKGLRAEILDIL